MAGTHTLAVLVWHGMGTPDSRVTQAGEWIPTFHEKMVEEIARRVARAGKPAANIAWEPVFWHKVLGPRQDEVAKAYRDAGAEWRWPREKFLTALGDAGAYLGNADRAASMYRKIHDEIHQTLQRAKARLDKPTRPVVFIANSLGCMMMSDYIWDRRAHEKRLANAPAGAPDPHAADDFDRLHTLAHIMTIGCNIPLFIHGFAHDDIAAIEFPHPKLPAALKKKAKWDNYYDRDDILGFPLAPVGMGYKKLRDAGRLRDIQINSGPILLSGTPLSHSYYWTDNDFTVPASEVLAGLVV